jgi:hypothetical protein
MAELIPGLLKRLQIRAQYAKDGVYSSRGGQKDDFRPLTSTLGEGGAWGAGTNM